MIDTPSTISRRQLLAGMGVAVAALLPGGVRFVTAPEPSPGGELADRLAGLVTAPDALRALGRQHLRQRIDRPSPATLAREILPPDVSERQAVALDDQELLRLVTDRVSSEYVASEFVAVDGWILTPTEARLAALVARHGGW